MACDGEIDKREIVLIKTMHKQNKLFGDIDINKEMDILWEEINKDGHKFLRDYLTELTTIELSEQDELKLIKAAIDTIKADEKVEYSEIKFFKVIRSKLKIDNEEILKNHKDFEEYLEEDIMSPSYLLKLQDDYFDSSLTLPKFDQIEFKDISNN